jgi:hypothetical protein
MPLPRFLIPAAILAAAAIVVLVLLLKPGPEAPPAVPASKEALVPVVTANKLKLDPEVGNPFYACETMVQKSVEPCRKYAESIPAELKADPGFHEYDCEGDILNPYLDLLDLAAGKPCDSLRTDDGRQLCSALAADCAGTTGTMAGLCGAFKDRDPEQCKPLDEAPEGVTGEYDLHFFGEFGCGMSIGYYRAARGDKDGCTDGQEGAHRALCEAVSTGDCQGRIGRLFEDFARLELGLCDTISDPWMAGKCREGVNAEELMREELGHLPT